MNQNKYEKWIKEFMESWKELDYERTLSTLDKSVEYYETPLDKPCSNFDEVINLWNVISENQKDITYQYQIIAMNENICIVNWQMTRTMTKSNEQQEIDGIFQISLNDAGKCTYFKQWRYIR